MHMHVQLTGQQASYPGKREKKKGGGGGAGNSQKREEHTTATAKKIVILFLIDLDLRKQSNALCRTRVRFPILR